MEVSVKSNHWKTCGLQHSESKDIPGLLLDCVKVAVNRDPQKALGHRRHWYTEGTVTQEALGHRRY